ncbi:hypothetical protein EYF80_064467 [Liparis tanakae]|uniref:Uncharacterized protein n=1 Tax=Liparis tanakae TaxID=230148 RepID=A0A4Z2E987_9TELE|nr:hypothetical protein EYF80_064467 [Liparis tanakae]
MPGSGRTLAITSSWARSSGTPPSTAVPRKLRDHIGDMCSGNSVLGLRPISTCEARSSWTFHSTQKTKGPQNKIFDPWVMTSYPPGPCIPNLGSVGPSPEELVLQGPARPPDPNTCTPLGLTAAWRALTLEEPGTSKTTSTQTQPKALLWA